MTPILGLILVRKKLFFGREFFFFFFFWMFWEVFSVFYHQQCWPALIHGRKYQFVLCFFTTCQSLNLSVAEGPGADSGPDFGPKKKILCSRFFFSGLAPSKNFRPKKAFFFSKRDFDNFFSGFAPGITRTRGESYILHFRAGFNRKNPKTKKLEPFTFK